MSEVLRRLEDCKDDFERDCVKSVQGIAEQLQKIYEGEIESDIEEGEKMTLNEYFDDFLDVEYIVNCHKEYKSAKVWITLGGPGICIDTDDAMVKLYWGSTRAEAPFDYNVRDVIDDIFEEIYNID